jgi:replicative DNA helicase
VSDRVVELPHSRSVTSSSSMSSSSPSPSPSSPEFERTPPQDLAAEQSVLGGMLLSKDAIADVVEVVRATDFYRPAHQTIYDVVLDLYGRGEPADPITVSAELAKREELGRVGGAPYLHTLVSSVPTAANAGYYARIVAEQAVLRRLVEAGTRIVQLGYSAAGEVDDVVDRAQQAIYDVTERRSSEDYVLLEALMQPTMDELEAIGSRGGSMTGVPTGFADLDNLTNGLHPGQLIVIAARPGVGKALALDTPLATPTGWTTMGEVRVGDELLDAQGRATRVVAATDVLTDRPCYEVHFSDGAVLVADAEHQWVTQTRASRRGGRVAGIRTTRELAATLHCDTADRRLNHSVATTEPLQLPDRSLPLSPYALGVWLGDGHSAGARFTSADPEIALYLEAEGLEVHRQSGYLLYGFGFPPAAWRSERPCEVCGTPFLPAASYVRTCGKSCGGTLPKNRGSASAPTCSDCGGPSCGLDRCQACRDDHGTVQAVLRSMGVLGAKHVPADYLRASESQRRALLAGLLDTDGTVTVSGSVQFTGTSWRLVEGVAELVASLGYRYGLSRKPVKGRTPASSIAYTLTFATEDDVFRLERKKLVHKERRRGGRMAGSRFVTAVLPVGSVPVRCVEVDNPEHLYLAGRHLVPTHNSTLGLDIARSCSIKHGMTSCVFSLEMSKTEITMRLLSAEARVPLHHMRSGMMTDDDWARLARRMGEVAEAPLFIDDSPNLTMMEIRAKARRLKQRHDLKLVVVDYLQLMQGSKRAESRQQEVSELSRSLKLLAKELECPVIAMSQLNRGPEQRTDKKPQLSDLRESGAIEQDADMVVLMYREDAFEKESPRAGEADFIVAKHRNGPTATVTVASQLHYSRFVDMSTG